MRRSVSLCLVRGATTSEEIEAALPALFDAVRALYDADDDPDHARAMALFDAKEPLTHGDVEKVEAAMRVLARDARWEARAAAAEVLRYLGGPPPIARALERACVIVSMAQDERDPRVRAALVAAFVDLKNDVGDALASAFALRFAADPDASVRNAVTGVLFGNRAPEAIAALVAASADPDGDVRDWACFGLGHQLGSPGMPGGIVDTPALREALAARLDDPNGEAREEAATGLALRDDERGVAAMEVLLARFDEDGVSERVLMTASERPSQRYVPGLEAIVASAPELASAAEALADCRAAHRRPSCGAVQHIGCACMRELLPRFDR